MHPLWWDLEDGRVVLGGGSRYRCRKGSDNVSIPLCQKPSQQQQLRRYLEEEEVRRPDTHHSRFPAPGAMPSRPFSVFGQKLVWRGSKGGSQDILMSFEPSEDIPRASTTFE